MADTSASQTTRDAELVYNFHRTGMALPATADAIFCLCSLDVRVAHRAAQLFLDGRGSRFLIFSGGSGKLTEGLFTRPEADVFADVARASGVPEAAIITEPRSTNTGENVRFTHELLRRRGLLEGAGRIRTLILVQKPYMERRTFATFMKQWPGAGNASADGAVGSGSRGVRLSVTSPQLGFAEYPDEANPRDLVISIMVGDLVRIRDYPAKGYQIAQAVPEPVWEAGQRLIAAGFNTHLP